MPQSKMIRVSAKGQIVLPKDYRDRMGISEGDYIRIEEVVDGILLVEKSASTPLSTLTEKLREEAASRGFNRKDLEDAITEVRGRKSA